MNSDRNIWIAIDAVLEKNSANLVKTVLYVFPIIQVTNIWNKEKREFFWNVS
jgi:hypothetical protein